MWKNKTKTYPSTADIARADISLADEGTAGEGFPINKQKS